MQTHWLVRRLVSSTLVALSVTGAARGLTAQDSPMSPDVKKHLRQLVNGLRQFRVGRDEVDWKQVESRTMAAAAGAQTLPDAFPAIRVALTEIRDPWAMYHAATGQTVGPEAPRCFPTKATVPSARSDVGYIKIVPVPSRGIRAEREAAAATRASIKAGDAAGALNWIVDLRGHFMGSLPAAVIGLSPLMGDGTAFKMQYADVVTPYNTNETSIKSNGQEMQIDLGKFALTHSKPRIAVLVDGGTAGVGELLAIAFLGRNDARVFGMPTCGIPPLRLVPQKLDGGAEFTLSAMRIVDRNDKVYRGPLEPHERIDDEAKLFERAFGWLTGGR